MAWITKKPNLLQKLRQIIKDFITKLKGKTSIKSLDKDLAYLDEYIGKLLKSNENKNIDKSSYDNVKYSTYDEYNSNVMIWANSAGTKPGDAKIFNKKGSSILVEADGNGGFVEIANGNYNLVRSEYEHLYGKENPSIYGNLEALRIEQRRNIWNLQYDENGRNGTTNSKQIRRKQFQDDPTGNSENLRTSNKRASRQLNINTEASSKGAFSMPGNEKYSISSENLRYNPERYIRYLLGNSTYATDEDIKQYAKRLSHISALDNMGGKNR